MQHKTILKASKQKSLTLLKRPRKRSLAKVEVGFDVWSKQRSNGEFTSLQALSTCLPALNDNIFAGIGVVFDQNIQVLLHPGGKYSSHIERPSRKPLHSPQSFPFLRGHPQFRWTSCLRLPRGDHPHPHTVTLGDLSKCPNKPHQIPLGMSGQRNSDKSPPPEG